MHDDDDDDDDGGGGGGTFEGQNDAASARCPSAAAFLALTLLPSCKFNKGCKPSYSLQDTPPQAL